MVAYAPGGKFSVLSAGVEPTTLAVTSRGVVYFTDPSKRGVWMIDPKGARRIVSEGVLPAPSGVRVNPDESLVVVSDHVGRPTWSFRVEPDGGLLNGEPFYHLELLDDVSDGPLRPRADGMTFDDQGYVYIATNLGVQICDQLGRVVGIIRYRGPGRARNVVFGGKDLQTLYITAGERVWKRIQGVRVSFPGSPSTFRARNCRSPLSASVSVGPAVD